MYILNKGLFPNLTNVPKHEPKKEEETGPFPKGLISVRPKIVARTDVVIFLDVQGCPSLTSFTSLINLSLQGKGYYGDVSVRAYRDREESNIQLSDDINEVIVITNREHEDAKFTRMLLDMLFWSMNTDEPTHFMLISRPAKYMAKWDHVVRVLEASGSDVIFGPSEIQLPFWSHSFDLLCKGSPHGLALPIRDEGPRDPKLLNFKTADQIGIFWVVEEFPSNPMVVNFIYSSMEETMQKKGYLGSVSLMAYVNERKLMDVPTKAGMSISYLPEGNKYERVAQILADILIFARKNVGEGSSLILVSKPFKDAKFDSVCESLRDQGFNVCRADLDYMVTFGTAAWSSRRMVAGYCLCDMCLSYIRMAPSECKHV
ncbi:unnamed protein product [Arabis nemorensis]|uniref:NYN domain-containing protein n=1 Tax=Arabis nemorensis TaxID=586526 RepID=A0A565C223_9BRAS|nr:unnamed protein product [Arabis nemorensis]